MQVQKTFFPDVFLLIPKVFSDHRGLFFEAYQEPRFRALGFSDLSFVQDNFSYSKKGVLRGMHFQWNPHQGKLVRAVQGTVYDVVIDIKHGCPTFGKWYGVTLSDQDYAMLWVPPGYAHGFLVLSEEARVEYKCTSTYSPTSEGGIRWNDAAIGIEWPIAEPIMSDKDKNAQTLEEWTKKPEFQMFNDTLPRNPVLRASP